MRVCVYLRVRGSVHLHVCLHEPLMTRGTNFASIVRFRLIMGIVSLNLYDILDVFDFSDYIYRDITLLNLCIAVEFMHGLCLLDRSSVFTYIRGFRLKGVLRYLSCASAYFFCRRKECA